MASNIQNKEEKLIVLFGESGVGKSTFINAIYNYTLYDSIEEAEKNNLKYLIPAAFTLTDADFNQVEVKIGNDRNEKHETGKAATQEAKIHRLKLKNNTTICLIDTPGVGDPDGCERDKENIESTFQLLEQFDQVHGICILMKPNNARLDLHFRYCFKELMTNLHKKAAPNIVFCYTHSKGTFFRPGDTHKSLEILVKTVEQESGINIPFGKNNIFCLDNEGFRYLAAKQSGANFDEMETESFSKSWKLSSEFTKKLFDYVLDLKDFDIKSNNKLHEYRNIVTALSKPIADISQNIQTNIKLANDKREELRNINLNEIDDLRSKLYLEQIDLVKKPLGYPRTVCIDPSCTRLVKVGNISKVDYVTHCHSMCYLKNVETETINNEALKTCQAFNPATGDCKNCFHHYLKHMHITYANEETLTRTIDTNVERLLNNKENARNIKMQAIVAANKLIRELEQEQKLIIEASSKFASFVKQNALMAFNDDIEEYLDLLIKEEVSKKQAGANNNSIINGLKDVKESYKVQKKLFEDALKSNSKTNLIDQKNIELVLEQICALRISGKNVKQVIDDVKNKRFSQKK